jgi:hypothetical protein
LSKPQQLVVRQSAKAVFFAALVLQCSAVWAGWGDLEDMHRYKEVFGLSERRAAFNVTMLESNAPGNVFHPGQQPEFVFQIENVTNRRIQAEGKIDVICYAQRGRPGDNWHPELVRLQELQPVSVKIELEPKAWRNITIEPKTPETKGGYGLVVDIGEFGRRYLTSYVRTFKPNLKRVQFPKQSLEEMPAPILARLGVQAIRWAVSYHPADSRRFARQWARIEEDLKSFHENKVTVVAEVGAGSAPQPLGRGRPHLDANDVMKGGKQDLAWLPEYDDDYEEFVYKLASEYGWPKGPITGFMLWNEPWEGLSISGWGADMIRYRNLYKRMGDAVFKAREEAGVDVLIGGCDSSTNTIDKLFPDGSDAFLPYLDFCSIHYQGLSSPVLYPKWHNRKHYKGRVLIWDTESWVANTDDRFAGVVATNRAAGYDRSMGTLSRIAVSTLSHKRVAKDKIRTKEGTETINRLIESRPLAAAYGAVQHFIGLREFKEILFKNGLPWVYVFHGLHGNPDDGMVVVVGDIGSLFQKGTVLFNTVRSLDEVKTKQQMRRKLSSLSKDDPERIELAGRLKEPLPFVNAKMVIDVADEAFGLYDVYGNPVPTEHGKIVIPLRDQGFFLRANPDVPGSFARLIEAIRHARIEGLEPLEIIPYDMTAPIETHPVMRLRLTSMRNHAVVGKLRIQLGDLHVDYPKKMGFEPRQRKWVQVKVSGEPRPDNTYPLFVTFDAGRDGMAVHEEQMHVNWISRKSIIVDGKLDDWRGVLPQTIKTDEAAKQSFEESMWLPFAEFEAGRARPLGAGGFALGYMAYDDEHFYFAAKIADDTPHPGTLRFATRDEDADFYPKVCYEIKRGERIKHVWPKGVRRFSYRRWPLLPSAIPQKSFDNVLIGFNAIPMEQDEWMTHLPGRMPRFIWYKTTDYEYALNKVADEHGGGMEIWRLMAPGMPYKHFFPRQPKHPLEGAVKGGKLKVRHIEGTRIVECALPWSEIPHVKDLMDEGKTVKFGFRVNHKKRGPDMELAMHRSAAEGISHCFHPNWSRSWPNELEFGFEK